MVTMSSFGKFQSGSDTELFREIRTIHASLLHSRIAVRIPISQSKLIHSRPIRRLRIAWRRREPKPVPTTGSRLRYLELALCDRGPEYCIPPRLIPSLHYG